VQGGPAAPDSRIALGDALPGECAGTADAVGLAMMREVRDVPAEWLKFVGHYAGQAWRSDAPRLWQKWLTKAAQDQAETDKRDRERAARASPGFVRPDPPRPAREIVRAPDPDDAVESP